MNSLCTSNFNLCRTIYKDSYQHLSLIHGFSTPKEEETKIEQLEETMTTFISLSHASHSLTNFLLSHFLNFGIHSPTMKLNLFATNWNLIARSKTIFFQICKRLLIALAWRARPAIPLLFSKQLSILFTIILFFTFPVFIHLILQKYTFLIDLIQIS